MQCYTCNLSGICKIFQMIQDTKMTADIIVSNCKMYNHSSNIKSTEPNQNFVRQRTPAELNSVSDRIKELTKQSKKPDDTVVAIQPTEVKAEEAKNKKQCPECGSTYVVTCSSCNKETCGDCATEAIDGKIYCAKCWEENDEGMIL